MTLCYLQVYVNCRMSLLAFNQTKSLTYNLPLNVGVNPLQSLVVIPPFFEEWVNVDVCNEPEKCWVPSLFPLKPESTSQRFTIRSRGKLIEIKLQVIHFVLRALIIRQILSKQISKWKHEKYLLFYFDSWSSVSFGVLYLQGSLSCSSACPLLPSYFWGCDATARSNWPPCVKHYSARIKQNKQNTKRVIRNDDYADCISIHVNGTLEVKS